MILIVDDRLLVQEAYTSQFTRGGYPSMGLDAAAFEAWMEGSTEKERAALRACLVADAAIERFSPDFAATFGRRLAAPVVVLADRTRLEATLEWFGAGACDVVRKPVHIRELQARIAAHRRRLGEAPAGRAERLQVFHDGRDPMVDGRPLPLPRRERRVLEHLASIGERRATKAQLHEAVYGLYDEAVEETVIESHISKLRKKLRLALGHDPIESRRYLGYRLVASAPQTANPAANPTTMCEAA